MRPTNYNPLRSWPENYWPIGGAPAAGLTYAWPHDYWPDGYWAEYWADYGVTGGGSIIPIIMHHLKQQGIS